MRNLNLVSNYFTNIKTRCPVSKLGPRSETLPGGDTCLSDIKKIC
jgi:hypothetical protein